MAHTSEHLAVLGNIERYYASEKRGRRIIKLAGTAQTKESTPSPVRDASHVRSLSEEVQSLESVIAISDHSHGIIGRYSQLHQSDAVSNEIINETCGRPSSTRRQASLSLRLSRHDLHCTQYHC